MREGWIHSAEAICSTCNGRCCIDAGPPLCPERIRIILSRGDYGDCIEENGYRRIKTRADGYCRMRENGRCRIHEFKPETCVAGPFTFSVSGHTLEIFLKRESVCPLVTSLKADRAMYTGLFTRAVRNISRLVASLPEEEIAIISQIPEPETDKVAEIPVRFP